MRDTTEESQKQGEIQVTYAEAKAYAQKLANLYGATYVVVLCMNGAHSVDLKGLSGLVPVVEEVTSQALLTGADRLNEEVDSFLRTM